MKLPPATVAAVLAAPGITVHAARGLVPPVAPDAPEADFLTAVRKLARSLGYLEYHTRNSRGSPRGFPDLVIAHYDMPYRHWFSRLIAIELKSARGRAAPAQRAWLDAFRVAGCEAYLWKPCDWDEVVRVLSGDLGRPT